MAPRANKSSYLKKCSIAVVGSLGKDAKISDIEKWTVNNGGAFNTKVNSGTTHVICTWDTYKQHDFALPKKYAEKKKLQFVKYSWLEDTLRERRVKPVKRYIHSRSWETKIQVNKKVARRQALLTGKSIEEVENAQPEKADIVLDDVVEEDIDYEEKSTHIKATRQVIEKERAPLAFDLFTDEDGVAWNAAFKGSELPDPEEGDYVLSVTISRGSEKYFKAQYEYTEPNDEPLKRLLGVGSSLDSIRVEFETFYQNKAGHKWSEHYAKLKAAIQNNETEVKHKEPARFVQEEDDNMDIEAQIEGGVESEEFLTGDED